MNIDGDYQVMRRNERAHFFSAKEQELILKLYEEERDILTAKSNTTSASKLREEAWQRIADKINTASDSGYKRTWQQVKVKHKNIVQTAKRRRAEVMRTDGGSATPSLVSAEDDALQHRDGRLRVDVLPGATCLEPLVGPDLPFINVSGHPVLLLPVTKQEPESLSSDDTDVSDSHVDGDIHSTSFPQRSDSTCETPAGRSAEGQTEDVRALYCCYLRKEMENLDQQMAFRALKMKKLEKEILLLDKQLV